MEDIWEIFWLAESQRSEVAKILVISVCMDADRMADGNECAEEKLFQKKISQTRFFF